MQYESNNQADCPPLELWAGVECTVNRVGNQFFDQLRRTGHWDRECDLDRLARLGARTVRYPVLWEHVAPSAPAERDWQWADRRLAGLQARGIEPIVGLLHHGSGPRYTSLMDPNFPSLFAEYARAVAERFPWVAAYTPINEPLTTARFSGLYGLWYPHARDGRVFARALFHQIRATQLAMRAIRAVNPRARLVQTDDLGTISSTPDLRYQARFENHRRWLTWDLLCGRVDEKHALWRYLRECGLSRRELALLRAERCPPDIVGINHYVTSDRFLDSRLSHYAPASWGGNGRHRYVDVEAVRVREAAPLNRAELFAAAWERYRIPVAITEAHIGCSREEQMRWLQEIWRSAENARWRGADVRAVTLWATLGSFDWDSLVTRRNDRYESGAYDVRTEPPRATALVTMAAALAEHRRYEHPVLEGQGWWVNETRFFSGAGAPALSSARPLLITGANGLLGEAFARICERRGIAYRLSTRATLDIADLTSVRSFLAEARPWAVINGAGFRRIDEAEKSPEICFRANLTGASTLARACAEQGIRLVTFSSDQVFDGRSAQPYRESSAVAPLNTYGRSHAEAERAVAEAFSEALIIRPGAFFGPWDRNGFVARSLRDLEAGLPVHAPSDWILSPTYVPDLVHRALDLLIDGETGIWHLANQGAMSWAEFARAIARRAGADHELVRESPVRAMGFAAARPPYSVLETEKGAPLGVLESALDRFFEERETQRRQLAS